jgi:tetratricopeptide (TPR) repeat protein
LNNWAIWYQNGGRPDSAEVLYRRAIEADRKIFGPQSRQVAMRLNNLGSLAISKGRFQTERRWLLEAISILDGEEGVGVVLGAAHTNLGKAAFFEDNLGEAEREFFEGQRFFVEVFGSSHPFPAVSDGYLGRVYGKKGNLEAATALFEKAIGVFSDPQPQMASRLVPVETWYGLFLHEKGSDRGLRLLRSAVERAREHLAVQSAERAEAEAALGICLMESGSAAEGSEYLRSGYERLTAVKGESHPTTAWARAALVQLESTGL